MDITLLEEHNGNLEFCSLGNSQVKYPLSFLLFLHGLPSSWTCRAVCFFHPLAGCGEAPPKSEWQSLCLIACHQDQALRKDLVGFTTAPWRPWSPWLGQAGFWGYLLHGMAGRLARSLAALPVTLTCFPVKESMKATQPAKCPKLVQLAFF